MHSSDSEYESDSDSNSNSDNLKLHPFDYDDMYSWQSVRAKLSLWFSTTISYTEADLEARKQYWDTQTIFLKKIFNKEDVVDKDFKQWLKDIIHLLEVDEHFITTEKFTYKLNKYNSRAFNERSIEEDLSNAIPKKLEIHQKNVIEVIKDNIKNYHIVVNEAPNSNRDGASKYKKGTLEEILARNTNAWNLILHFRDVQEDNIRQFNLDPLGLKGISVWDFQRRYLLMMLKIVLYHHIDDKYIYSDKFLTDLLDSEKDPDTGLSIFYGAQNIVYEAKVPIGNDGMHTQFLLEDKTSKAITIAGGPAPDNRSFLQGGYIDKKCSSNLNLRSPETTLEKMMRGSVINQCEKAISEKEAGYNTALILVMPGCEAFKNSKELAMDYFFDELAFQYHTCHHNIPFYVVEINPDLHKEMKVVWEKKNALYIKKFLIADIILHLTSMDGAEGLRKCQEIAAKDSYKPKDVAHDFEKIIAICQSRKVNCA